MKYIYYIFGYNIKTITKNKRKYDNYIDMSNIIYTKRIRKSSTKYIYT